MASRKLRAIIFDIGRVLIRIDVHRAMTGLAAGLSLSPEEIWRAIENDPRWPDWQEGRMSAPRLAPAPVQTPRHDARALNNSPKSGTASSIPSPCRTLSLFEKLSKNVPARLALQYRSDPRRPHGSHL